MVYWYFKVLIVIVSYGNKIVFILIVIGYYLLGMFRDFMWYINVKGFLVLVLCF